VEKREAEVASVAAVGGGDDKSEAMVS